MLALLTLLAAPAVAANAPQPVPLYPDGVPEAVGDEDADKPHIRIYRPDGANTGAACIVCPGGGYGALAVDHEGHQVAVWMQKLGITAVVLKYRLGPRYRHPAPLQDVTRAVRLVRSRADELGIDRDRVGVMGFSAGGHLASTIATHYDAGDPTADDPVDRQSCRPSFSILAYPVISLGSDFAHAGSRRNLLGSDPDPDVLASLTNETQVTSDTPPTFLFHTADDSAVPVKNSLVYYDALVEAGVDAELHIFRHGRHGVGFAPGSPTLGIWPDLLENWLRDSGWLTARKRVAISGRVEPADRIAFGAMRIESGDPTLPIIWTPVRKGRFDVSAEHGPVAVAGIPYLATLIEMGAVVPFPTIDDATELPRPTALSVTSGGASEYTIRIGE